jgi:hypothetical protein
MRRAVMDEGDSTHGDKQWRDELKLKSKSSDLTFEEAKLYTLMKLRSYVGWLLAIPLVLLTIWLILLVLAIGLTSVTSVDQRIEINAP